jgi:hypothetical protein
LKGPSLTSAAAQFVNVPRDDEQVPDSFMCTWEYEKFTMSFTNIQPPAVGDGLPASGNWFFGQRGWMLVNRSGYRITPTPSRAGGMGRGGPGGQAGRGGAAAGAPPEPPKLPFEPKDFRPTGRGAAGADEGTVLHTRNFLDCVKSRQKPVCEIEIGFHSTLPCLIALLAIRQRRSFTWDGKAARPV